MNVVKTVIHAENLKPGMRNTPSCKAAKPSAEPKEPAAKIKNDKFSFVGKSKPKTCLGSPGAAFGIPAA